MKVCGVITASTASEVVSLYESQLGYLDLLELRLDYMDFPFGDEALSLVSSAPRPVIATMRPQRHGGQYAGDEDDRLDLLRRFGKAGAAYVDLESDVPSDTLADFRRSVNTILSYHNFRETPVTIRTLSEDLASRPADILKIATHTHSLTDVERLADLQTLAGRKILIGMGECGMLTRILAHRMDSAFCYAALGAARESAPGQLQARDLEEYYRVRSLREGTEVYGILGWPVSHSLSPQIHNACFRAAGMDRVYVPMGTPTLDGIRETCRRFAFRGLSVTIPHKSAAARLCDELDTTSQRTGAVNTVAIREDRWVGYNTDLAGFLGPLRARLSLEGLHATVLGSGGAASAAVCALTDCGARVCIASRSGDKGQSLAQRFGARWRPLSEIDEVETELLVNATPGGMWPHPEDSPYDLSRLNGGRSRHPVWVYDLVYNPRRTRLLLQAQSLGFKTIEGLEMFLSQAAEQFRLWTGETMPFDLASETAEMALNASFIDQETSHQAEE